MSKIKKAAFVWFTYTMVRALYENVQRLDLTIKRIDYMDQVLGILVKDHLANGVVSQEAQAKISKITTNLQFDRLTKDI